MEDQTKRRSMHGGRWRILAPAQRGMRYHRYRENFFSKCHGITLFITAFSGTTGAASLFTDTFPEFASPLIAVAAATATAELIFRFSERARRHANLARDFIELEREIERCGPTPTEEDLKALRCRRLEIESSEPNVLRVLNVICDDEVSIANGVDERYLSNIRWHQRAFAPFFDFMPNMLRRRTPV